MQNTKRKASGLPAISPPTAGPVVTENGAAWISNGTVFSHYSRTGWLKNLFFLTSGAIIKTVLFGQGLQSEDQLQATRAPKKGHCMAERKGQTTGHCTAKKKKDKYVFLYNNNQSVDDVECLDV